MRVLGISFVVYRSSILHDGVRIFQGMMRSADNHPGDSGGSQSGTDRRGLGLGGMTFGSSPR